MLIQAGAGAGKTMFGWFLEQYLWTQHSAAGTSFVPLFVSLPKATNPFSNIVEQALLDFGFSNVNPENLTLEPFVFILDGMDELPLEKMPCEGILASNGILAFTKSKVIITSRDYYIMSLQVKFGTTVHHHLTQQRSGIEDVFIMPFDNSQVYYFSLTYSHYTLNCSLTTAHAHSHVSSLFSHSVNGFL
jgi:hypothetical protein